MPLGYVYETYESRSARKRRGRDTRKQEDREDVLRRDLSQERWEHQQTIYEKNSLQLRNKSLERENQDQKKYSSLQRRMDQLESTIQNQEKLHQKDFRYQETLHQKDIDYRDKLHRNDMDWQERLHRKDYDAMNSMMNMMYLTGHSRNSGSGGGSSGGFPPLPSSGRPVLGLADRERGREGQRYLDSAPVDSEGEEEDDYSQGYSRRTPRLLEPSYEKADWDATEKRERAFGPWRRW